MRGRLEAKAEYIATVAGHITEAAARQIDVDPSNLDPSASWNMVTDIATALMEEDIESVMDRLVQLQVEIGNEYDVYITRPEGV